MRKEDRMRKEDWGFYFHVPFCEHRCSYCDFFTTAGFEQDEIEKYFSYMTKEFELFAGTIDKTSLYVSSIYVGGGTPSFASAGAITSIVEAVLSEFDVRDNVEITVEVNPKSAMRNTFDAYRTAGVNRLSIGIQSQNPDELETLERIHSVEESHETVETARTAGFDNISIDLMYGTPRQTHESWKQTLSSVASIRPEHVSAYSLILEKGTKMTKQVQTGELTLPGDEKVVVMFETAQTYLADLGYSRYEVSNYAKPGFESRHNLHYWKRKPYRGFGMSAHSFHGKKRSWNTTNFTRYFDTIDKGVLPVGGSETLSMIQEMNEVIMLGLRMKLGLDLVPFGRKFGRNYRELLTSLVDSLLSDESGPNLLTIKDNILSLTTQGIFVSDAILSKLFIQEKQAEPVNG